MRRDRRADPALHSVPNTELNGHQTQRLANPTNITFHGIESEALLIPLDMVGVCVSSGSACLADSVEPSHVIKAMKPDTGASRQMIRFLLDPATTQGQIGSVVIGAGRGAGALRGVVSPA